MLSLSVRNFIILIRDCMVEVFYRQTPTTDASMALKKIPAWGTGMADTHGNPSPLQRNPCPNHN